MTKITDKLKSLALIFTALAIILTSASVPSFTVSAADAFESSIAAFPQSYKVLLRGLHKKHPNWTFVPMQTNLDWNASVDEEFNYNRSLVHNADSSDFFKSREVGDYDYATGRYIQKDAGFVRANKLAVSYYMDPRNFLNEQGIFQFEDLTFNEQYTIAAIESVLQGTFMSNKKIEYYDAKGKLIKTNDKYSKVIYNAGKKNNVNPCYLAAKIIGEVGKNGSTSTKGTHSAYPGIYNYFNIGASDGANPTLNGLKYAATGTTNLRPWNTPQKAIIGGAQFCANDYIARGQHTAYLQRFNVNPKSASKVYTHQYMTNLTGVVYPAYQSYISYLASGLLEDPFVFIIPIFRNMSGEKNSAGTVTASDAENQTGKLAGGTMYNVRLGPSTMHDKYDFQLAAGTAVTIKENLISDAEYFGTLLRYPFWHKIGFNYQNKAYNGYVYSEYIDPLTATAVPVGEYQPLAFTTNPNLYIKYVSTDPRIARIDGDTKITFLKAGTVKVLAYDSTGSFSQIKYNVVKNADSLEIKNVNVTEQVAGTVKVSFSKNSSFDGYEVYIVDKNHQIIVQKNVTGTSAQFDSLKGSTEYSALVRGYKKQAGGAKLYSKYYGDKSFTTKPFAVTGLLAKRLSGTLDTVSVNWQKTSAADGYLIYTFDPVKKVYTKIAAVSSASTSYLDKSENAVKTTMYSVRSYKNTENGKVYSNYSPLFTYNPPAVSVAAPKTIKQRYVSNNEMTLKWSKVKHATKYEVFKYDSEKKQYIRIASTPNSNYVLKGLFGGSKIKVKVRAVAEVYSKKYYSPLSSAFIAYTAPNKVKKVKQKQTSATAYALVWTKMKSATGYQVYKYDKKAKKYKLLAETKENFLRIKGLEPASAATYKVRAFRETVNGKFYGPFSSAFQTSSAPKKVGKLHAVSVTRSSYTLKWKKSAGADGYVIYRINAKTGKPEKLKTLRNNDCFYTVKKLKPNQKAQYQVRAFKKMKSNTSFGVPSEILSVKTKR